MTPEQTAAMMPDEQREKYNALAVENARMAKELASAPAWHPRPTCPGLWLCLEGTTAITVTWKTQQSFDWWLKQVNFSGKVLYFGPIPAPPEEAGEAAAES